MKIILITTLVLLVISAFAQTTKQRTILAIFDHPDGITAGNYNKDGMTKTSYDIYPDFIYPAIVNSENH